MFSRAASEYLANKRVFSLIRFWILIKNVQCRYLKTNRDYLTKNFSLLCVCVKDGQRPIWNCYTGNNGCNFHLVLVSLWITSSMCYAWHIKGNWNKKWNLFKKGVVARCALASFLDEWIPSFARPKAFSIEYKFKM